MGPSRKPQSTAVPWIYDCKITTIFQTDKIFFIMPDVKSLWQRLPTMFPILIKRKCQKVLMDTKKALKGMEERLE